MSHRVPTYAPSEASIQPAHPRSPIRVYRLKKPCLFGYPKNTSSEDSDQAALMRSLIWMFSEYIMSRRDVFWLYGSNTLSKALDTNTEYDK